MFTGIIEGFGNIAAIRSSGQGKRMAIDADFSLDQSKTGDSICVSGACLTAVTIEKRRFEVDVSPETLNTTIFDKAKIGDRVNLERALRLSDRIDGHLVSGHIDDTGIIKQRESQSNAVTFTIGVAESLTRYMIAKGSVAVDGISLTINHCDVDSFSVSIIPHTAKLTTIGFKSMGDRVNIETDMIGKYIERFVSRVSPMDNNKASHRSAIDQEFLIKTGFIG
jgi:riboflavin synthase